MRKQRPRKSAGGKLARHSAPAPRRNSPAPQDQPGKTRRPYETDLVIVTGMSGSGKGSVLKVFEDLGYYCVDNLPVDLIPKFAELTRNSREMRRAALVVDIREGKGLKRFPAL